MSNGVVLILHLLVSYISNAPSYVHEGSLFPNTHATAQNSCDTNRLRHQGLEAKHAWHLYPFEDGLHLWNATPLCERTDELNATNSYHEQKQT